MNVTLFFSIFYSMMGIEALVLIPFLLNYKSLDFSARCIFFYILSCIVFAGGSVLVERYIGNNMWFFSLMHFIQFVTLSIFYYRSIHNPTMKAIIKYMPILILAIFIFDLFFIEGVRAFNSISSGVKQLVVFSYGLYLFLQLLKDRNLIEKSIYIDSLPIFWYNSGVFIFACTEFLFCISYNHLQALFTTGVARLGMTVAILSINYIVGMISMILLYIGFSKIKKLKHANY